MDAPYILAIDQGTTNTKAILLDHAGRVVKQASQPLMVSYPQEAWVEQDAGAIWQSVVNVIGKCLDEQPQIAAIGLSNQRESVVLWDRATGAPLGPCVIWQCQRGTPLCLALRTPESAALVHARTGLTLDPMFSASKMRWLIDQLPNGRRRAEAGELCVGTVDSWLLYNLTAGAHFACDMTNASRTLLFDLTAQDWDAELLALFGIPRQALPEIRPSSALYGMSAAVGALPAGLPIAALIGDSHAALFGHAGFQPGAIKATYGTGSSLMTPTATPLLSDRGLSSTVAWSTDAGATFALEGNIYITGAAVEWLGRLLGLANSGEEIEALAAQVADTGGAYLVPAFVGLGAPYWNDAARGLFAGLTRGTTAAHLARATLESIAYQIKDVFDVMQAEAGATLTTLLADGGPSQNDLLMQFQADIIGCPVLRSASPVVSAVGAGYLAGLAVGYWASDAEIAELPRPQDRFEPRMAAATRDRLYAGWQEAMARTLLVPSG